MPIHTTGLASQHGRGLAVDRHPVRKAANLAIDRNGMKMLLNGLMIPAQGFVVPGSQWFGKPKFEVKYDPAAARNCWPRPATARKKPVKVKILISASGSGQMQPLPMNEYVQQNLAEVGIRSISTSSMERHDQHVACRAKGRGRQGRQRYQLHLLHPGPVHRLHPPSRFKLVAPNGHQLGLLPAAREMDACSRRRARPSRQRRRTRCCARSMRRSSTRRCSCS